MIAVCASEQELTETSLRLTDANMAALSALRTIEQWAAKGGVTPVVPGGPMLPPAPPEPGRRRTEC